MLTGVGNGVTTYDQNFHAPRVQQFSVAAYTFGNAPRTTSLRGPGFENWDISLFKTVSVRDRASVQFRAQAFNTPYFAGPNTAFCGSNFGKITTQANFPRYLQLGLRIAF